MVFLVYIIVSGNKSYVGFTNDFFKRWKQHNKILKGGAKYTSKYNNWTPVCIIDGLKNKSEAMQCEWRLKRASGPYKRLHYLSNIINQINNKWTKNSPIIASQNLVLYVTQEYKSMFKSNYLPIKDLSWF
tara:strand:+ start:81 stop:470 length:390 start_codon:yes stop_codon:yes gene_type:complete